MDKRVMYRILFCVVLAIIAAVCWIKGIALSKSSLNVASIAIIMICIRLNVNVEE